MRRPLAAGVTAVALLAAGCGSGSSPGSAARTPSTVTVFAAASLTEAFTQLASAYRTSTHTSVTFSFAGSQQLVAQVQQGAPADVIATADQPTMATVATRLRRPATAFARNRLVVAVPHGNPAHIRSLADLARHGLAVVLAAPTVPAGHYAAQALAAAHVPVHPKSLEDSVRGVVTKLVLGEADAGIVYATDVTAAHGRLDAVTIPAAPTAVYMVGALRDAGRGFVAFVLSKPGQAVLARYGFLPPS